MGKPLLAPSQRNPKSLLTLHLPCGGDQEGVIGSRKHQEQLCSTAHLYSQYIPAVQLTSEPDLQCGLTLSMSLLSAMAKWVGQKDDWVIAESVLNCWNNKIQ